MRTLSLTPQARLDLLEIWNHLAEESLDAANRVNVQVDADLEKLRQFPGLGHRRPDIGNSNLFFWKVFSWLIIYRYDESSVMILRVVHGHRNLRKLLKGQR